MCTHSTATASVQCAADTDKKVEPHNQPITHKDFLKYAWGSGEKTDMLIGGNKDLRTVAFYTLEIWD